MKLCSNCNQEKELSEFSKKRNKLQPYCKECNNAASREYYRANKEKHVAQIRKRTNAQNEINRQYVWDYLSCHPCVDCGETDPVVLEFDHQGDKEYLISSMVSSGYSTEKISKEIAKCLVRCANCHRRKTAKDFNYYARVIKGGTSQD